MAHRLAPEARADLDEIWDYIFGAAASAEIADRRIIAITDRIYLLSRHPRLGRSREDLPPGLRSFVVQDHVIFYRVEGDDVVILRVLHSRRDIESILRG